MTTKKETVLPDPLQFVSSVLWFHPCSVWGELDSWAPPVGIWHHCAGAGRRSFQGWSVPEGNPRLSCRSWPLLLSMVHYEAHAPVLHRWPTWAPLFTILLCYQTAWSLHQMPAVHLGVPALRTVSENRHLFFDSLWNSVMATEELGHTYLWGTSSWAVSLGRRHNFPDHKDARWGQALQTVLFIDLLGPLSTSTPLLPQRVLWVLISLRLNHCPQVPSWFCAHASCRPVLGEPRCQA